MNNFRFLIAERFGLTWLWRLLELGGCGGGGDGDGALAAYEMLLRRAVALSPQLVLDAKAAACVVGRRTGRWARPEPVGLVELLLCAHVARQPHVRLVGEAIARQRGEEIANGGLLVAAVHVEESGALEATQHVGVSPALHVRLEAQADRLAQLVPRWRALAATRPDDVVVLDHHGRYEWWRHKPQHAHSTACCQLPDIHYFSSKRCRNGLIFFFFFLLVCIIIIRLICWTVVVDVVVVDVFLPHLSMHVNNKWYICIEKAIERERERERNYIYCLNGSLFQFE